MGTNDNTADLLQKLSSEMTRKRVLIVDRHQHARNSLRMQLSTLGIASVHGAGTSAEVLRQVGNTQFDIILSDYLLDDGRDGQQLLEELRQQRLIPLSTVFMVITGERAYQNVVAVAELTPDDYLIKPFTADQLQSRLVRAVYKKHFFTRLFEHLDNDAYTEALAACEGLLARDEGYIHDTLRYKGEILNALGRHDEARALYRQILDSRVVPWARMGLATALRGMGELAEAESIGQGIIKDYPEFLAAYDFVAAVREEMGKLTEAQDVLQQAAVISPKNSARQRMVGDVAVRNKDLETAERAYSKVLERYRGSSLKSIDDYTNLSRVMLDRGHAAGARLVSQQLRRDLRGNRLGEFAALVVESLCAEKEGEPAKAKEALAKAMTLQETLVKENGEQALPQKLAVDLAQACLATGNETRAQEILRKVAAENHENRAMIAQIEDVFARTGMEEAGQSMLAQVGREIVELNNRGVLAARSGDVEGSVQMLIEAAERVPNLQFLVNASKAIFTLLERKGWNEPMAERGLRYLKMAQAKDMRSPKVISARELYKRVAKLYGVALQVHGGRRSEAV